LNIQEIQQLPAVTYLPHLPDWIPGVCNLRGNIVSIVDLKQLLGFESALLGTKTRLVVVRTGNQDLTTGFIVDEVVRIIEVEPEQIRQPAGPLEGHLGQFLKGTYEAGDQVICVLDLEITLNSPTLRLV
jgi:purine-binding chemotaxis protein CheW